MLAATVLLLSSCVSFPAAEVNDTISNAEEIVVWHSLRIEIADAGGRPLGTSFSQYAVAAVLEVFEDSFGKPVEHVIEEDSAGAMMTAKDAGGVLIRIETTAAKSGSEGGMQIATESLVVNVGLTVVDGQSGRIVASYPSPFFAQMSVDWEKLENEENAVRQQYGALVQKVAEDFVMAVSEPPAQ